METHEQSGNPEITISSKAQALNIIPELTCSFFFVLFTKTVSHHHI